MTETITPTPVLLITGSVGVGKTSVAWEVSEILENRGISHAYIDADVCYIYPKPKDDPTGNQLYVQNVQSLWNNVKAAGAQRLILTVVVESLEKLEAIKAGLPETTIQVVRLHAPLAAISERLRTREIGNGYDWHMERATKLLEGWEKTPVEDHLVETEGRNVREIAEEVIGLSRWC